MTTDSLRHIEIKYGLVCAIDNKRPYTIDGKHLKKGYREIIKFKDGSKVRVLYLRQKGDKDNV